MGVESQIRWAIRRYLDGSLSFEQFEDLFLDETWDLHRPDDPAPEVVYAIERYIAERTGGHLDEAAFRQKLEPLAPAWAVPDCSRADTSTKPGRATPVG